MSFQYLRRSITSKSDVAASAAHVGMVGAGRTDSSGVCLDSSTDDKSLRSLDSNETFAKSEKQLNDSSLDNDDIEQTARDADAREDETQRGSSNAERAVGRDSLSSEGKELVSSITTAPPLPGSVYFANGPVYNAAAAERFKMLRAKIERLSASSKRSKYKVIAVASAAPREGKSTVAVNLARAFAEDPLGKTLLIDCDLRNPTVHEFFKLPKYPGVREILEGAPIDGAPIHQVFPRMDVLCAGKEIDNPIQLFLEPEGAKFLRYLRKKYRHIVVDTPPVLLCAEAITLSSLADASLLVVRSGQTKKEMIRSAIETLRKNNILGTVMNDEIVVSRDYGSKQYSKYYT